MNDMALASDSTAGIGLEIARKLAVAAAKLIVAGRNQTRHNQAAESIRAAGSGNIRGVLADRSTVEGATALMQAAP
jgi:short-subunit dehydrogenase involved in D-alanine esterification of teichoic acids